MAYLVDITLGTGKTSTLTATDGPPLLGPRPRPPDRRRRTHHWPMAPDQHRHLDPHHRRHPPHQVNDGLQPHRRVGRPTGAPRHPRRPGGGPERRRISRFLLCRARVARFLWSASVLTLKGRSRCPVSRQRQKALFGVRAGFRIAELIWPAGKRQCRILSGMQRQKNSLRSSAVFGWKMMDLASHVRESRLKSIRNLPAGRRGGFQSFLNFLVLDSFHWEKWGGGNSSSRSTRKDSFISWDLGCSGWASGIWRWGTWLRGLRRKDLTCQPETLS